MSLLCHGSIMNVRPLAPASAVILGGALVTLGLAAAACKPSLEKKPPPKHSVALATPVRGALAYRPPGASQAQPAKTDRRIEQSAQVATGQHGRATLALDEGGWVLLDRDTAVQVSAAELTLVKGQIWVDARGATVKVRAGGGAVSGTDASFNVKRAEGAARVYCGSAEVTLSHGEKTLRLVSGMLAKLGPDQIEPQLEALWEDWTGGLARAGSRAPRPAAAVGVLQARTSSEVGRARSPLLVREHRVRARIEGQLAITRVEQHFFNPRSTEVVGTYRVRLPAGAIIGGFGAGPKGNVSVGHIATRARKGGTTGHHTVLEWEGTDRYVATVPSIRAGGTTVVRFHYVQWLDRRRGRRRYVYPMGGGQAPKLGEFSLIVDVKEADADTLKAGLGAKREGDRVLVRRSDFQPRADFVLELLDDSRTRKKPVLYHARSGDPDQPRYAALSLPTPFGKTRTGAPGGIRLVVVADVSAGTGEAELALMRTTVDALLRQLTPEDEVALLAASVDANTLGKGPALAPATDARVSGLLAALGRIEPGGGSDLEQALLQAARLLPKGRGAVVYVGDGRPTLGTLAPGLLRDRLARRLTPPRLFAVGIGEHADLELLSGITVGLGFAEPVHTAREAPRAALRVVAHAARPTYRQVRVSLGPTVDRLYPRRPVTVEDGAFLHVLGRLRGAPPTHATVRGRRDGEPFEVRVAIRSQAVRDYGDLKRRWALRRVQDLLRRGAGRESVAEIGVRYGVITPFTGLVVGGGGRWYHSNLPEDPAGTFVPAALRGAPPAGRHTRLALEPGWSTRGTRSLSLQRLYQRALRGRIWTAVRASFDRKAAARPDLSGRVVVRVAVNPDGGVHRAEHLAERSSLTDPDVVGDVMRLVRSVRLPATPTGERFTFVHVFQFDPQDISDVPARCLRKDGTRKRSPESYRYLAVRRALWRERLWRKRVPVHAHRVWRGALACGEIRLDTDARALLRLMLDAMRTTAQRVDLYHRLRRALPWVRAFLRREILRRVRTLGDVRAVRAGLALDGGLNRALLEKMLEKAKTDAARIEVVRRFLALSPRSLTLQVMLMRLLERKGQTEEAERLAWKLRADPAADAGVRQQVGAFFLRRGNRAEARRAFSEIVELAPYDPWARRRLGQLLLARAADAGRQQGEAARRWSRQLYADAYREYETLAWLNPGDDTVLLLMANAAAGTGRLDWALRLQQRVSASAEAGRVGGGPAAWARLLSSVRLAALREQRSSAPARLAAVQARGRRMGLHGWARDVTLAVRWAHPDARFSLWVGYPGREGLVRAPLRGGAVGIEGLRRDHAEIWGALSPRPRPDPGNRRNRRGRRAGRGAAEGPDAPLYLELRSGDRAPDRVRPYHGVIWLLWKEGEAKERIERQPLTLSAEVRAKAFLLTPKGRLQETKVRTPPEKRARKARPEDR